MPQSFTPVVPVTNADVTANLAPQLPLGSETRIIAGLYAAVQKALNMMAAAAIWWQGGTLGDPVNAGDNTKRITAWNPFVFKSNVDVEDADLTALDLHAVNNVDANLLIHSFQDMAADRDLSAGRNAAVGGTMSIAGQASLASGASVAGVFAANGGGTTAAPMTCSSSGRYLNRGVLIPITAGAVTLNMNTASMFVGQSTMAGDQTATITNAVEGDTIEVIVGGIHTLTFAGTGTSGLTAMNGTSNTPYLRAVFLSSVWRVLSRGILA